MWGVGKLHHNTGSARGQGGEGAGSIQQADLPSPDGREGSQEPRRNERGGGRGGGPQRENEILSEGGEGGGKEY